jgi:hypothetical protein
VKNQPFVTKRPNNIKFEKGISTISCKEVTTDWPLLTITGRPIERTRSKTLTEEKGTQFYL